VEAKASLIGAGFFIVKKAVKISSLTSSYETRNSKKNKPDIHQLPVERKSYDEIVDLFARGASPTEILAFRPSVEAQDRVRELLERNAADELTEEEAAELECFGEVEHFMQLIKIRAREYLNGKT
jgi:hypothetical protein